MNIDLKGWNDEFYAKELGASKKHVLDTIEFVLSAGVHVEITTLIIPGKNDSLDEMREEAKWLASLSRDIPLHITRYFPNYKYTIPPTDVKTLNELHNVAKEHLTTFI